MKSITIVVSLVVSFIASAPLKWIAGITDISLKEAKDSDKNCSTGDIKSRGL